ncbi:MAG TPA: hypothetical protein VL334_17285 [Anaerolineae bacterium]|nr:hypothetical protein [Anaerolineae bacterium]
MNVDRSIRAIVLILLFLAACGSPSQPAEDVVVPAQATALAAPLEGVASYAADGALLLEAPRADRVVHPGADEVFDFKMVNTTGQAMPVVVVLEHADGQRWRTSLCVEKQCLLGDGSEPSVTDPVILPPYLEQPFQAHVFVDAAARPGQSTALTLRVEPLIEAAKPQSVIFAAQVDSP